MDNQKIYWQSEEYLHQEKGADWYIAVAIISLSIATAAFVLGNFTFAILIIIGTFALTMFASRKPSIIKVEAGHDGIKVGRSFYPYHTIETFWIDETVPEFPKLLMKSSQSLVPRIVIPLGNAPLDELRMFLQNYIHEEEQYEPLSQKIMEYLGF